MESLSHSRRRREWLAARTALKRLLLEEGIVKTWQDAQVLKEASGKPWIGAGADRAPVPLDCALSHKGDYAVAALALVSGLKIGVDLEILTSCPSRLRSAFEHPLDSLAGLQRPEPYYTVLWTLKEAAAKAFGAGVASLPRFACRPAGDAGACEVEDTASGRVVRAVHGAGEAYIVSLAWMA